MAGQALHPDQGEEREARRSEATNHEIKDLASLLLVFSPSEAKDGFHGGHFYNLWSQHVSEK
jgi:hypothetical protein